MWKSGTVWRQILPPVLWDSGRSKRPAATNPVPGHLSKQLSRELSREFCSSGPAGVCTTGAFGQRTKIILITLVVLVFLIGGTVVGVAFFLRSKLANIVQVKEGQGGRSLKVAINAPGGQIKVTAGSAITEEQLGVPIYPRRDRRE